MTGDSVEPAPPLAPPSDSARPPAPRPSAGLDLGTLAFVVSLGALAVAVIGWYQHSSAIDELRGSQRALAGEVASLRKQPIIDLAGAPMLGPDTAVVTLVEFSDYECPFCIRHFQQTMPRLVEQYITPGKIRYAFRDWPVDQLHPQAIRAHEAAHCAGEQNRYWDMHTRLFSSPGTHTPDALVEQARAIGLDMEAFSSCVKSGRSTEAIRATGQQAQELGATGTPAFFIGLYDKTTQHVAVVRGLTGAQPYEVFARTLDEVIAQLGR